MKLTVLIPCFIERKAIEGGFGDLRNKSITVFIDEQFVNWRRRPG
jgi:hypothetical protein